MPGSHPRGAEPLVAHVDGGSRGNPGPSGWGVFLPADGSRPALGAWGFLHEATNNVAEYSALVALLEWAKQAGVERLDVRSDSELLVRQMEGRYRVKAPGLQPLFARARLLAAGFRQIRISHVRRELNKGADALANHAMDRRTTSPVPGELPDGLFPPGKVPAA